MWNNATARKMAKGIGPKWGIFNLKKYFKLYENRLSFSQKKKKKNNNERLFERSNINGYD